MLEGSFLREAHYGILDFSFDLGELPLAKEVVHGIKYPNFLKIFSALLEKINA